jgi:hypothetical protein
MQHLSFFYIMHFHRGVDPTFQQKPLPKRFAKLKKGLFNSS